MKAVKISLNSIEKVKSFVNDISSLEGKMYLCTERYVVDAKSIMGIFSLDLSVPLKLEMEQWEDEYAILLKKYLVE